MVKYILLTISLIISISTFCQEDKLSEVITAIAEELASDESDPEAAVLYIELLNELVENPVHVNTRDQTELSRLFFLSDFQIKALADYTRLSGRILSPFEIANIPGFDRETARMIFSFITLNDRTDFFPDSAILRSSLLTNLSLKSSDIDSSAPGSPLKILTKYRFTSGNISGGFTAEKDQGEKFLNGYPPLPDFLSAHLSISGSGFIRKIVIGDYAARFGMGTNINTGIRTGISLTAPGNFLGRDEIKPYTSSDENNFLRGVASQFKINNLSLTVYYSVNKIDATLNSTNGLSDDYIETIYRTGLHNTASTLTKKDVVTENFYGANMSYNFDNFKIGLIWSENRLSLPLIIMDKNPDEIYDFEGDKSSVATIYYSSLIKRIILFGEFSKDSRNKLALVQGITLRPADRLTINILYRNYEPGFAAFHTNGQGSTSQGDNLQGFLGSFSFEAAKYLFISAGYDIQYYPWMKYRCSAPSMARKGEVRLKYIPSERFTAELGYYEKFSMQDEKESIGITKQEEVISRAVRCSADYSPFEGLTFGSRLDFKVVGSSGSTGMLLLQDLNYRFPSIPLSFWFRYCIFNTDDWDSRLYTWENDLLYSFSIPALSGEGTRSYIVAGWKLWGGSELRVKYGITTLTDNGENLKDIQELRMQFRIRF